MQALNGKAVLLRLFMGEMDKFKSRPLYEAILYAAKEAGLAGATVIKGIMSYGASSVVHTAKILAMSDDLPIIVEIVDKEEKINLFLKTLEPYLNQSKYGGLVTIENIEVIYYKSLIKE